LQLLSTKSRYRSLKAGQRCHLKAAMVSNDMSDDDSVIDPHEDQVADSDNDEGELAGYDDADAEAYGSDGQARDDSFDVPDADDDDDEEDDEPRAAERETQVQEQAQASAAVPKRSEKKEAPKKDRAGGGGTTTLLSHFSKQGGAGKASPGAGAGAEMAERKRAQAEAEERAAEPIAPVQPKTPLGASRPKGGKAIAAAAGPKEPQRKPASHSATSKSSSPLLSFNNDSDDDTLDQRTMIKNPGYGKSIAAVDAVQEFDDGMMAEAAKGSSGATVAETTSLANAAQPPRVHEAAKKRRYVIKNEKTKKWCEYLANGLLSAPECDELFQFSIEDLTIDRKKDRVAMQTKLADEQMSKMLKTVLIGKIKMDGERSGSGPGITNLIAAIPNKLPLTEGEREDMLSKMNDSYDEAEVVQLVLLDHETVKRMYKVPNAPMSALYNPNTNSGNKYRVPLNVTDQKNIDDNFVFIGSIETVKKGRSGKRTSDEANGGASSKNDGKRPATEEARERDEEEDKHWEKHTAFARSNPSSAQAAEFFGKEIGLQNCQAWSLTCDEDDMYSLFQTHPGKWVLFRGKF
tara:strand:+ start:1495 stop:3219 length:1725 start_codon:yes stop_codon:yes gene_type:complete